MLALIALGGKCFYTKELKSAISECDIVIAADRGYVHIKELGLTPEYLVGDMDSIPALSLFEAKLDKRIKVKEYNPEKNMTDSEIATKIALEKGADKIIFIGALGDRPDHVLGNQMYAAALAKERIYSVLTDGVSFIYTIGPGNSPFRLSTIGLSEEKDVISIIPACGDIKSVNVSKLKYTLEEFDIPFGSQRGMSNTVDDLNAYPEGVISIGEGVAFLLLTKNS